MAPTWKRYSPDPTPDGEPEPGAPPTHHPRPPRPARRVRSLEERTIRSTAPLRTVRLVAVAVGVLVLAGVGWLVFAIFDHATQPGPQTTEGYRAMVDDLREETGGTQAFQAVVYPGYAVVEVPIGRGDERYDSFRWDGGLSDFSKGTSPDAEPFDLAEIDPAPFAEMCRAARALVEDPRDCYLIVEKPSGDDDAWIRAYASNEYSQGGYISFDLDGTEVDRTTW